MLKSAGPCFFGPKSKHASGYLLCKRMYHHNQDFSIMIANPSTIAHSKSSGLGLPEIVRDKQDDVSFITPNQIKANNG